MDDSKPDLSGLRASVNGWLFWADIALKPGKLNAQDDEAARDHRESLEAVGHDGEANQRRCPGRGTWCLLRPYVCSVPW